MEPTPYLAGSGKQGWETGPEQMRRGPCRVQGPPCAVPLVNMTRKPPALWVFLPETIAPPVK